MTGYTKYYYYSFRDNNNTLYKVEIHKYIDDVAVPYPLEVIAGNNPFTIEYPERDKFSPVWGSGCSFNLLSTIDRQFIGLYTADIQEYQIRLLDESDNIIWCGFLDSEFYEEEFSEISNYSVSFTGTDGFALLDRLNYVNNLDGEHYQYTASLREVLHNILFKLQLPFNNIYIGLSTTSPELTIGAAETILDKVFISNENWYNEDGEPETCRTVLESILAPFGAFILQDKGNIYITDINYIMDGTELSTFRLFKKYDSTLTYLSDFNLIVNLGNILTDRNVASNKQRFTVVSGINRQLVNYSNYKVTDLLKYRGEEDYSTINFTTDYAIPDANYESTETDFENSKIWNKLNNGKFKSIKGTGVLNNKSSDSYLKILPYSPYSGSFPDGSESNKSFTLKAQLPYVLSSTEYNLKLQVVVNINTEEMVDSHTITGAFYYGKPFEDANYYGDSKVNEAKLNMDIIVKDVSLTASKKYIYDLTNSFDESTGYWDELTNTNNCTLSFIQPTKIDKDDEFERINLNIINNQDVDLASYKLTAKTAEGKIEKNDFIIPLNFDISGNVEIIIYNYAYTPANDWTTYFSNIAGTFPFDCSMWIKEINLIIVDKFGNEVKKIDTEYVADTTNSPLYSKWKDAGKDVKLLLGTNLNNYPSERGNLMKFDTVQYLPITTFTRNGVTDTIEKLLLRSVVSNYSTKTTKLDLDLNKVSSLFGYLTYNTYLDGKKYLITKCVRDLGEAIDSVTIEEVFEDNVNII